MKKYKVFLKRDKKNAIEDLIILKTGANYYALSFGITYFIYKKMWKVSALWFLTILSCNVLGSLHFVLIIILYIIVLIFVCIKCNDWIEYDLIHNKKYEQLGFIVGESIEDAKLKFLENFNASYKEQKIF
jgi:hypothetical protein